ncbi:MAG: nitroreductase [Acidimicrobiales bacterium]
MNVNEAVSRRKSIRSFLSTPVADSTMAELLEASSRAPSGGNVQPWRVYVVNGDRMRDLKTLVAGRPFDEPEYAVYPASLWEPYRTNRFAVGEAMYEKLGIPRDDKAARLGHVARNYTFFDAPCGFFCFIDRGMGPPQWSDLGMFLQTFMLLAQEAGLDTCPQESWASYGRSIAEFVGAPDEEMLFCGMAVGHHDPDNPVNDLVSDRMPLDDWCRWV